MYACKNVFISRGESLFFHLKDGIPSGRFYSFLQSKMNLHTCDDIPAQINSLFSPHTPEVLLSSIQKETWTKNSSDKAKAKK